MVGISPADPYLVPYLSPLSVTLDIGGGENVYRISEKVIIGLYIQLTLCKRMDSFFWFGMVHCIYLGM